MKTNNKPEIRLINYFDQHWYVVKEDPSSQEMAIPSVTTILGIERKSFLERWRGDVGNKVADEKMYDSQQRGKRIHHAFYTYLIGGLIVYQPWENPTYSDEELNQLKKENEFFFVLRNQDEMIDLWKLQRFDEIVKPDIAGTEATVFDIQDDEAGTLDFAFRLKKGTYAVGSKKGLVIPEDGLYVGDLKTGSTIEEAAFSQLAVYGKCSSKIMHEDVKGGFIFHTGAKTKSNIEGLNIVLKTKNDLNEYYKIYKHLAAVWKARNPNAGPRIMKFPSQIKRGL